MMLINSATKLLVSSIHCLAMKNPLYLNSKQAELPTAKLHSARASAVLGPIHIMAL